MKKEIRTIIMVVVSFCYCNAMISSEVIQQSFPLVQEKIYGDGGLLDVHGHVKTISYDKNSVPSWLYDTTIILNKQGRMTKYLIKDDEGQSYYLKRNEKGEIVALRMYPHLEEGSWAPVGVEVPYDFSYNEDGTLYNFEVAGARSDSYYEYSQGFCVKENVVCWSFDLTFQYYYMAFDSHGNWIERVIKKTNGNVKEKRYITYYKDDEPSQGLPIADDILHVIFNNGKLYGMDLAYRVKPSDGSNEVICYVQNASVVKNTQTDCLPNEYISNGSHSMLLVKKQNNYGMVYIKSKDDFDKLLGEFEVYNTFNNNTFHIGSKIDGNTGWYIITINR